MAGMQEKATKWLHDNRKQLKQIMDQRKSQHQKSSNQEKKSDVNNCSYCRKVFFDAEFLVKHVLRRHSDELVLMHKKLLNSTSSESTSLPSSELMKYMKAEFTDLKDEIKEMKQVVSELASTNSCSQEQNPLTVVSSDEMNSRVHIKSADSIPDCTVVTECTPNNSNILVEAVTPADLETKVHDLFEKYKKDAILKEVKTMVAVNKEEVYEKLSNRLQIELQNMLLHHLDKKSAEWKKDISKLQNNVIHLTELVTLNTKKIDSPETLQKLEKKFEQQLQLFLISSSFSDDKRLSRDDKKKLGSHKSLKQSNRKKKSLYTSNSQGFNQTEETTVFFNRSEIPQHDKNQRKRRKANNSKLIVEKEKKQKSFISNEIKYILDERLRALNIDPRVQSLSLQEYEKKMQILKSEEKVHSSLVVQFSKIRKEMDSYVDDLVKSELKAKCPKKLHFSVLQHSTPIREKGLEAFSVQKAEKEALVEFSGDCYAQGDCHIVIKEVPDTANASSVPDVEKRTSEPLKNELLEEAVLKCDTSSMQSSDDLCAVEIYGSKPHESVKSVSFKNGCSHNYSCSSQNFEDLSELSSLSDLED